MNRSFSQFKATKEVVAYISGGLINGRDFLSPDWWAYRAFSCDIIVAKQCIFSPLGNKIYFHLTTASPYGGWVPGPLGRSTAPLAGNPRNPNCFIVSANMAAMKTLCKWGSFYEQNFMVFQTFSQTALSPTFLITDWAFQIRENSF